jgi:pimeloyl-ACP methyl ester carboxylesterase
MRSFHTLSDGRQLHVRTRAGKGTPLLMLHAAPGSARMLAPLQARLASPTYALDLPGMGDSDALPAREEEPEISEYAADVECFIEAAGLAGCDVYGTLSGVRVALDLALRGRIAVRRLVLDGIGIPEAEALPELLRDYAPPFLPDLNGTHLWQTFLLCRDQYLFYPWYARDAAHRRPTGLPAAELLHIKTMEALKSGGGFRPLIRAAFRYPIAERLAALRHPALISADGAAVRPDLPQIADPPVEPLTAPPDNLARRAGAINSFLA